LLAPIRIVGGNVFVEPHAQDETFAGSGGIDQPDSLPGFGRDCGVELRRAKAACQPMDAVTPQPAFPPDAP